MAFQSGRFQDDCRASTPSLYLAGNHRSSAHRVLRALEMPWCSARLPEPSTVAIAAVLTAAAHHGPRVVRNVYSAVGCHRPERVRPKDRRGSCSACSSRYLLQRDRGGGRRADSRKSACRGGWLTSVGWSLDAAGSLLMLGLPVSDQLGCAASTTNGQLSGCFC